MKRQIYIISGTTGAGKNYLAYLLHDLCSQASLPCNIINADPHQAKMGASVLKRTPDDETIAKYDLKMYKHLGENDSTNVVEYQNLMANYLEPGINLVVVGSPFFVKHCITSKISYLTPECAFKKKDVRSTRNAMIATGTLVPNHHCGALYHYQHLVVLKASDSRIFKATRLMTSQLTQMKSDELSDEIKVAKTQKIIGYDPLEKYLLGLITSKELTDQLYAITKKYAKQQLKFFKTILQKELASKNKKGLITFARVNTDEELKSLAYDLFNSFTGRSKSAFSSSWVD